MIITHLSPYLQLTLRLPAWLRGLLTTGYVMLMTLVLIQPSGEPVVGPAAPRGFNMGWEIFMTGCHLVAFSLLTVLLWWALLPSLSWRRALVMAVLFVCGYSFLTETLQALVPDRSASLFDLTCNCGAALWVAWQVSERQSVLK